jgi:hypothetical protein
MSTLLADLSSALTAPACILSGGMDASAPASVLSELGELRRELQGELKGLVEERGLGELRRAKQGELEERGELEQELQALSKEIESKQRELELMEATERQIGEPGRGQPATEGVGEAQASTQVRRWAKISQDIVEPVCLMWNTRPCRDRSRLHSSGPAPRRPMPIRSLSPY